MGQGDAPTAVRRVLVSDEYSTFLGFPLEELRSRRDVPQETIASIESCLNRVGQTPKLEFLLTRWPQFAIAAALAVCLLVAVFYHAVLGACVALTLGACVLHRVKAKFELRARLEILGALAEAQAALGSKYFLDIQLESGFFSSHLYFTLMTSESNGPDVPEPSETEVSIVAEPREKLVPTSEELEDKSFGHFRRVLKEVRDSKSPYKEMEYDEEDEDRDTEANWGAPDISNEEEEVPSKGWKRNEVAKLYNASDKENFCNDL